MAETPSGLIAQYVKDRLPALVSDAVKGVKLPEPKRGKDGVGIQSISQPTEDEIEIVLTNGEKKRLKIPKTGQKVIVRQEIYNDSGTGSGGSGTATVQRPTLIAEQPIIAYKIVTTNDAGQGIYADASTRAHVDQVIGLAAAAAAAGSAFEVIESGFVTNSGWSWVAGEPLFLGNTGDIVRNPTAGVFTLQIGYAKSATEIYLRIGRGVLRA